MKPLCTALSLAIVLSCVPAAFAQPTGFAIRGPQTAALVSAPSVETIHLEADKATLTRNTLQKKTPGFTGTGYAGDFVPEGAKIVWTIPKAQAGLYTVRVRYSAPSGEKGYDLVVNGKKSSGMLPKTGSGFATISAGKVELVNGSNTIAVERGWGYYQINAIDLAPAGMAPALRIPPAKLSDPKATAATRALFGNLRRVYGTKTLTGQSESADTKYLATTLGKTPAILSGDFIEYSPTRVANGAKPGRYVEGVIESAKRGQVVSMLWHWNAPAGLIDKPYTDKNGKTIDAHWWRGFYTDSTTFDLAKALNNPKSAEYKLLLLDIDTIAAQMKKLSGAGVPVLWRPLHEAEGGWFWWGAKGPQPFKKLWRLLHDRMTNQHNLHNLIWVYSSGTNPQWYPGDDVVDIVGIDQYPSDVSDPLATVWDTLLSQYSGRKMLALTEFGGVPDIAKMRRYGVRWSYFASWQGDLGPRRHSIGELRRLYNAPNIVTLKELPNIRRTPVATKKR